MMINKPFKYPRVRAQIHTHTNTHTPRTDRRRRRRTGRERVPPAEPLALNSTHTEENTHTLALTYVTTMGFGNKRGL